MVRGLQKYAGDTARQRASSPKLQVLNTALITAQGDLSLEEARADHQYWGRLVESAVGAHLANAAASGECTLYYWRNGKEEVDYVVRAGKSLISIEVKSSSVPIRYSGSLAFAEAFHPQRSLLVGGDGIPIEDFLSTPVTYSKVLL